MKNFEELTEEQQNEVILNIGNKLTGQEIWYWEGLVHKLREYEQFVDSDEEIQKGLVDRIKRQDKEIAELKAKLEMYENGVYFSSKNDKLQERIDKAIKHLKEVMKDEEEYEEDYIYNKYLLDILQGSDKE